MEHYIEKATASFRKITDGLAFFITALAALIIGIIAFCLVFEVVSRHFGASRAIMEELPRMLVPWFVLPMMGVLYKAGRHIAVEVLPERLSPKNKCLLNVVVSAIVLGVAVELTYAGITAVIHFKNMGLLSVTEFETPMWIFYLVFPVAFGLLCIFALEVGINQAWRFYQLWKEEQSEHEGGKS